MHERVFQDTTYCVSCKRGVLEDREEPEKASRRFAVTKDQSPIFFNDRSGALFRHLSSMGNFHLARLRFRSAIATTT